MILQARAVMAKVEEMKKWSAPIVTEIVPAGQFWMGWALSIHSLSLSLCLSVSLSLSRYSARQKISSPTIVAEDYHQRYLEKNPGGYCNHKIRW
jgi:peptide methionine sulfoxide reductase MsrA